MFNLVKDDFDENIDDIMNSINKILENDIITIYGTAKGDYSYTSIMGAKVTLPKIDADFIEINK